MDVQGKTVLLTGGSAGIGRELARQLKERGANVVLTGRNAERLAGMRDLGFETIQADLDTASGVDALVAAWGERGLDILVNNAGQGAEQDFCDGSPDPDEADACIYSNLSAPIRLITKLLPLLHKSDDAAIVNVTSGLAITPSSSGSVYSATKAGLRSFTFSLRQQLAGTGILVVEALPPMVETQMTAGRTGKKMSARDCAKQILDGIAAERTELYIGQSNTLRRVYGLSPALARSLLLRMG